MLHIIKRTKLWFSISIIIIIAGIISMLTQGMNMGIDFKGGTLIEVSVGKTFNDAEKAKIVNVINKYDSNALTNSANNNTQIDVKTDSNKLTEANVAKMMEDIKKDFPNAKIKSSNIIGATIGNELKQKSIIAVSIAIIAMMIYIAIRFEFFFGISSVIALAHDVLVVLAFYSIFRIQLDTPFIAAILTVLGYSMNDTIVVFDRIRENLKKSGKNHDYGEIADHSINQTIKRSIFTVTTTLITISAITIGVPEVRNFGVPLIIGIISGCYSSIFIASPSWVLLKKKFDK